MPRRVIAVSLAGALTLLGDSLLYVALPLHAAALGLSGFQVGLLLSGNRFVRMVTNTAAARLMHRFAPGPPFVAATALAAVTTAMYTLTPAFLPFLLARLLWGLCFSALRLGAFITVLAEATDRTRGQLMGLYRSISRGGSFVAVIVGGAIFEAAGYRAAMLAMAVGTTLAVPLALVAGPHADRPTAPLMPPVPQPTPATAVSGRTAEATSRPWHARLRERIPPRNLLAVDAAAFSLSFVARGVVTATLALYLRRAFGERLGPDGALGVATVASWLIGVRWATEIGLATPLGALSDHIGRVRSAVGWMAGCAAAMLTLALAPSIGVAAGGAIALFIAASGLGSTLDAAAGDLAPPGEQARVMSAYADWSDLGAALGPLVALTLAGSFGLRPTYVTGAALLSVATVGLGAAFRPNPPAPFPRREGGAL